MIADIVVGLSFGDEGKGKVTHQLLKSGKYTHCLRYNGSNNAGHTIYHKGEKFVLHSIPMGVFFGVKSIIGAGCVVNLEQFFSEIEMLEEGGIPTEGLVCIANSAHVITDEHLEEDGKEFSIGTTKKGNGPAYRDKYARTGTRAEAVEALNDYTVDLYKELHSASPTVVLLEGAQGFGLDIDWGDYPYVTSSHCTSAGALLNGIPPFSVRKVYGVAKAYETYVGAKKFEPDSPIFQKLRDVGNEYGATTGRPRQCNWTNLSLLEKAAKINGITDLIINKVDVMREVGEWNLRFDDSMITRLQEEEAWKNYIRYFFNKKIRNLTIYFSETPERI